MNSFYILLTICVASSAGFIGIILWQRYNIFKLKADVIIAQSLAGQKQEFQQLSQNLVEQFRITTRHQFELNEHKMSSELSPLGKLLEKFDAKVHDIELKRTSSYENLQVQIQGLLGAQKDLRDETQKLIRSLRSPNARGKWGEIQLRRIVELSGMLEHCDFSEQMTAQGDDKVRPDLVIHLPGERHIVVDAKVPLSAYLEAIEMENEDQKLRKLKEFTQHVQMQVQALSSKSYASNIKGSVDFVVLFLPGDIFLQTVFELEPLTIEKALEKNVVIATPMTLISLLKAIAFGWKQADFNVNAKKISDLAHELCKRVYDVSSHMGSVGKSLKSAADSYNKMIGSYESRLMSTVRKIEEFGVVLSDKNETELVAIANVLREIPVPDSSVSMAD